MRAASLTRGGNDGGQPEVLLNNLVTGCNTLVLALLAVKREKAGDRASVDLAEMIY